MDVNEQIAKYKGRVPCMQLIKEYVENNQAAEYVRLVESGSINADQAAAALVIDTETINGEIRMMAI